jgi:hypothetical protein
LSKRGARRGRATLASCDHLALELDAGRAHSKGSVVKPRAAGPRRRVQGWIRGGIRGVMRGYVRHDVRAGEERLRALRLPARRTRESLNASVLECCGARKGAPLPHGVEHRNRRSLRAARSGSRQRRRRSARASARNREWIRRCGSPAPLGEDEASTQDDSSDANSDDWPPSPIPFEARLPSPAQHAAGRQSRVVVEPMLSTPLGPSLHRSEHKRSDSRRTDLESRFLFKLEHMGSPRAQSSTSRPSLLRSSLCGVESPLLLRC